MRSLPSKSAKQANLAAQSNVEADEELAYGKFAPAEDNPWRAGASIRTSESLRSCVDASILHESIHGLADNHPDQSAKRMLSSRQALILCTSIVIVALLGAKWPMLTLITLNIATTLYFICAIGFRIWLLALGWRDKPTAPAPARTSNQALPIVTILLPLYRDAAALPMLTEAIDGLDYPEYKKDVKLLLEEDDQETIVEAFRLRLDQRFQIIITPDRPPRTKPKACNVGLAMARGGLIVIYDAEDSPEPDQLRKAAAAFAEGDKTLACVQARLNYYNKDDNWLTSSTMPETPVGKMAM